MKTPRQPSPSRAFTLIEILVVIVIIAMLAGMVLGALQRSRETARYRHTEATIVKINSIIMRKYESYKTRRLPINFTGLTPKQAAEIRLYAIRDLQRMEMPERWNDVLTGPIPLTSSDGTVTKTLSEPALHKIYVQKYNAKTPGADHAHAKCLYMQVMTSSPEARSMFSADEIADVDGDGWLTFIDGWGRPISFLRWAPGFTPLDIWSLPSNSSNLQIPDPVNHHDPFDPRGVDPTAFHLVPLIYAGVIGKDSSGYDDYGISPGQNIKPTCLPFKDNQMVGQPTGSSVVTPISNHRIEQR